MDIFSNIRLIGYAVGGTVLLALVLSVLYMRGDLAKAKSTIMAQGLALEEQVKTIFGMKKDAVAITDANNDVNQILDDATTSALDMNNRLSKIEHAAAEDAQGQINEEMKKHLRCIELATGSKVLKDEVNDVCPQIIKRAK